jgi:hypothetical protein
MGERGQPPHGVSMDLGQVSPEKRTDFFGKEKAIKALTGNSEATSFIEALQSLGDENQTVLENATFNNGIGNSWLVFRDAESSHFANAVDIITRVKAAPDYAAKNAIAKSDFKSLVEEVDNL